MNASTAAPPRAAEPLAAPALGVGLAGLALFLAAAPAAFDGGDAAVYAEQIADAQFGERSVHLGYYLLGWLLTAGGAGDRALNQVSAILAAGTLVAVYWLAARLAGSRALALVAAGALLGNYLFVRHAVFAEVYMAQTFFVVLAVACWQSTSEARGLDAPRAAATGVAVAAGTLVTPSTLLAVPAFAVADPRRRRLAVAAAAGAAGLGAALPWVLDDYLFGPRGLLGAAGTGVAPVRAAVKEGGELLLGFGAVLPLIALGGVALVRQRPRLAAAWLTLWAVSFVFGERFGDVPVQLPTWVLLAPLAALGAWAAGGYLERRRGAAVAALSLAAAVPLLVVLLAGDRSRGVAALPAWLVPSAIVLVLVAALPAWRVGRPRTALAILLLAWLAADAALAWALLVDRRQSALAYRAAVETLAATEEDASGGAALAVGGWSRGRLLDRYVSGVAYSDRWLDLRRLRAGEAEATARWRDALDSAREVWLLTADEQLVAELRQFGYRLVPVGAAVTRALPPARQPVRRQPVE